jgi:hypothetical protein
MMFLHLTRKGWDEGCYEAMRNLVHYLHGSAQRGIILFRVVGWNRLDWNGFVQSRFARPGHY